MKNKFLEKVAEQIADERSRKLITAELKSHLLDKIDYYVDIGYSKEEAEKRATEEMGNPEDTAVPLNSLHHKKHRAVPIIICACLLLLMFIFSYKFFTDFHYTLSSLAFSHRIWLDFISLGYVVAYPVMLIYAHKKNEKIIPVLVVISFCLQLIAPSVEEASSGLSNDEPLNMVCVYQPFFYSVIKIFAEGFPAYLASRLSAFYERAGMMHNLNGTDGSVTIIGAVSPQGGDFSEPVTQNTKRFVRCFWGLDKSLAYARHFPAIHWLTSYSEYLTDLGGWYRDHVSPNFVDYRNRLMAILNQESSLMEIVKLIGGDVLPDDQKLTLEIARVIRLGFLQQNAFHKDDTCVSMEKQFKMMEVILYLYQKSRELVARGMPMSVLKAEGIFEKVIAIKYDVPNDNLQLLDLYHKQIDDFYDAVLEKNA